MHVLGNCPKCRQGLLGLRVCGGKNRHLVVLCDECDAVWTSSDASQPPAYPRQPRLPCPFCGDSLLGNRSRWATIRDIRNQGWEEQIAGRTTRVATRGRSKK